MRKQVPLLMFLLATTSPALSQGQQVVVAPVRPTPLELALDDGVMFLGGAPLGEPGEIGFAFGLRAGLRLSPWLMVEGRYRGSLHDSADVPGNFLFHSGTLDLKLLAINRTRFTPYLLGGLGLYGFSAPEAAVRRGVGEAMPQAMAGAGFSLGIIPSVAIGVELIYQALFSGPPTRVANALGITGNVAVRL